MNRILVAVLAGLVSITSFVSGDAWAQNQVLLGERHVSDRSERDTINVGRRRGKFTGFRVKAEGAPIEFKRITVHFENGSKQTLEKNRILGRGASRAKSISFTKPVPWAGRAQTSNCLVCADKPRCL